MSNIFKVICAECQRGYPWKPEHAGKRGKCKCGQIITMPMAPPQQEQDELYELAELAGDARTAKVDPPKVAAPAAAIPTAGVAAEALPYASAAARGNAAYPGFHRREIEDSDVSADAMIDPIRDRYVPLALLAVAFVISVWWLFNPVTAGKHDLNVPPVANWMINLFDVGIGLALAMVVATRFGLGFGSLGPTLLKYAGLTFSIVAAQLWLPAILKLSGAMSATGDAPFFYILLVEYCMATLFIGIAGMYLFRMDASEMAMLAITYLIVGFLFDLVVVVIAVGVTGALHPPKYAAPPPALGRSAAFVNAPLMVAPGSSTSTHTLFDVAITQRIQQQGLGATIFEGNLWKQLNRYAAADKAIGGLIDQLYAAGAVKVYIDTSTHPHPLAYVVLPADQTQRDACNLAAEAYRKSAGLPAPPPMAATLNQQYLVVALKK